MSTDFVAAVIGGLIAGLFTLCGVLLSHRCQERLENNNNKNRIKSVLQSLHDEIETVINLYEARMGRILDDLPDGKALQVNYPISSDYFIIYNCNSAILGDIQDENLRKQIIKTYSLAKGMIDSFLFNNDLNKKYDYFALLYAETNNEVYKANLDAISYVMIDYAKKLKLSHEQIKSESTELLLSLKKNIALR